MLCLAASVLFTLCSTGCGFPGQNTPPVFDMKREWIIPEDEPVGRRVTTVRTKDDENDPIEYGIEPAVFLDGSSYFTIDKKTGKVFVASALLGLAGSEYYLFITANDGHQTAKIEVYVRIVKASDSSPESVVDSRPAPVGFPPISPFAHPGMFPDRPRQRHPPHLSATAITGAPNATSVVTVAPSSGSEDPSTMSWVTTVLPLVVTVSFAPVLGVVLWLLRRRCKMQKKIEAEKKLSVRQEMSVTSDDLDPDSRMSVFYLQRSHTANSNRYESGEATGVIPENRKWEFPRHHLRFLGLLGEGCFGQVWKCEALNVAPESDATGLVAVKTLKENASEKEKKDLVNELEVMKLLEPHANVVTLLGCCTDRDPLFLIMEYAAFGKLQTYLRESRAERVYGNLHGGSRQLTSRDLTAFAYQVAKGMEYIAAKGIIHRDLAARNILVGDGKTCKVADFGFARDVVNNHVYERKSEGRLPIRWMAPESLFDNIYTTKTDVWSFGVLMWEIVTLGSTPYPGLAASEVMRQVKDGHRLEKPDHCKREVYNIMFYCWEGEAEKRPFFAELVLLLDKLLVSENDYIELDRFPDHSYYNVATTELSGEKL